MKRDFTLKVYKELCESINRSGYKPITVKDYLLSIPKKSFVIMRHDVDRKPENALAMAKLENSLGIKSTYYFRMTNEVFRPDVIKQIASMGHEIGYHYEVLDKAKGDYKKAIKIFEEELKKFREVYDVKTICMHGNPLTPWFGRDLWKKYDFKVYSIIGDAYLSINFSDVLYFTDTGRTWSGKYSVKDYVDVENPYPKEVNKTLDIIEIIKNKEIDKACILTHPQRWNDALLNWLKELSLQSIKNILKLILKKHTNRMRFDTGVIIIGNHVQALGIIRSLGKRGIPVYLMNDNSICIGRFSRYLKKFIKIPESIKNDESGFVKFVVRISKKNGLKNWVLIPTNDYWVYELSKNKKILEKHFKVSTPHIEAVKFAYNKKMSIIQASKINIPVPKTIFPKNLEDLSKKIHTIKFPVIIKGIVGHEFYRKLRKKAVKVNSEEELLFFYKKISSVAGPSEIMIQEIIPGNDIYSFCSFFKNNKFFGVWMGRKIRQHPSEFGTGTFAESVWIPELFKLGKSFLKSIEYSGVSEMEFKKDSRDGKFKLIEVNARTWLWHTLSIRCGVDFPYIIYKDMTGREMTEEISTKRGVKWVHIITDFAVFIKCFFKGEMKIKEYFSSLRGEKEYAVFSLDDPLPFIAEVLLLPFLWEAR